MPVVAVQSSGSNVAWTWISTSPSSRALQRSAAYWNACSRCAPTVVPVLPPTGVAGVGSLKPTPAAFPLTIVICTPAQRGDGQGEEQAGERRAAEEGSVSLGGIRREARGRHADEPGGAVLPRLELHVEEEGVAEVDRLHAIRVLDHDEHA